MTKFLFRSDDELSRFSINLNIIKKKITMAVAKLVKVYTIIERYTKAHLLHLNSIVHTCIILPSIHYA